jgi:hypothetical protein
MQSFCFTQLSIGPPLGVGPRVRVVGTEGVAVTIVGVLGVGARVSDVGITRVGAPVLNVGVTGVGAPVSDVGVDREEADGADVMPGPQILCAVTFTLSIP